MKKMKKRSRWQIFKWALRHPLLYSRATVIQDIHIKRIIRENIEMDYRANKKYYDREFEKEWRKEMREMDRPVKYDRSVFPPVPLRK